MVDSSGAAYVFFADGSTPQVASKYYFAQEKEQFVLFLAVLPILLIVIPLLVFSCAMYLNAVHKSGGAAGGAAGVAAVEPFFSVSMTPLEEYASMHGSSSSSPSSSPSCSTDSDSGDLLHSSATSSTPFSLSASRQGQGLVVRSRGAVTERKLSSLLLFEGAGGRSSGGNLELEHEHDEVM